MTGEQVFEFIANLHRHIDELESRNLLAAKETVRLLDLRERQLADCTRAMREVSTELMSIYESNCGVDPISWEQVKKLACALDAARSGGGTSLPSIAIDAKADAFVDGLLAAATINNQKPTKKKTPKARK